MSNSITSQTPLPHPIPARDELGPLVGTQLGGFEITSYIGEGPTGAVYRAQDRAGTQVAIKVMHQELSSKKESAGQLRSDFDKLAAKNNTHLPPVHETGFGPDGHFFYVTD